MQQCDVTLFSFASYSIIPAGNNGHMVQLCGHKFNGIIA